MNYRTTFSLASHAPAAARPELSCFREGVALARQDAQVFDVGDRWHGVVVLGWQVQAGAGRYGMVRTRQARKPEKFSTAA